MYTSQQATDFNQRVDLGNSYCNCFHLMCRVEKSTWYIFKKERCSRDTPRKVLGTTNSLALRGFNTVDRFFFSCGNNIAPKPFRLTAECFFLVGSFVFEMIVRGNEMIVRDSDIMCNFLSFEVCIGGKNHHSHATNVYAHEAYFEADKAWILRHYNKYN